METGEWSQCPNGRLAMGRQVLELAKATGPKQQIDIG